ncbi:MAG: hypothetical protein ABSB86_00790 [Bryobacteraceae bacterium]|jgi:hypothetical protein
MAAGAANHHEDVEQLRQRFVEFRQAHAVRSRLPEELWTGGSEAGAAGRDHGDGEALGLDRPSLQKWTDRLEPRPSIKARKPPRRQLNSIAPEPNGSISRGPFENAAACIAYAKDSH